MNAHALPRSPGPDRARLKAIRLDYARRTKAHLACGGSDLAEAAMARDVSVYLCPERHALERRVLFRETPQFVCLSADIPQGGFRTFTEAGAPILLTRGKDGALRAFLNICPHRGASVCREREGKAAKFTCWFHGWTFAADGRLIAAPEQERFEGAMGGRDSLRAIACAERHGLVFVLPTPGMALDLDSHLGPFADALAPMGLESAERVKEDVLPVAANWKYALDTYGEGYHFATLHKTTIAPYFRSDLTLYDRFGPHHRIYWPEKGCETWLAAAEADWPLPEEPIGIHYLFPNAILFAGAVSPGKVYLTTFRHYPGETVGETLTYKTIYALGGVRSDDHRAEVEAAFDATAEVVRREDYVVAAQGWANLAHLPAHASVVFGRQELALQNVHRAIDARLGLAGGRA